MLTLVVSVLSGISGMIQNQTQIFKHFLVSTVLTERKLFIALIPIQQLSILAHQMGGFVIYTFYKFHLCLVQWVSIILSTSKLYYKREVNLIFNSTI